MDRKHPLNQSYLINYGLHLIRAMESNLRDAKVFVTGVRIAPKDKEILPF